MNRRDYKCLLLKREVKKMINCLKTKISPPHMYTLLLKMTKSKCSKRKAASGKPVEFIALYATFVLTVTCTPALSSLYFWL